MPPTSELAFNEGKDRVLASGGGLPATSTFLLSNKPIAVDPTNPQVGELYAADTYATLSEIVAWGGATPYARISTPTPNPSNGIVVYNNVIAWATGAAIGGDANVWTLVLVDGTLNKAILAWDLSQLNGGAKYNMSLAGQAITISVLRLFLMNLSGT